MYLRELLLWTHCLGSSQLLQEQPLMQQQMRLQVLAVAQASASVAEAYADNSLGILWELLLSMSAVPPLAVALGRLI